MLQALRHQCYHPHKGAAILQILIFTKCLKILSLQGSVEKQTGIVISVLDWGSLQEMKFISAGTKFFLSVT